MSLRRQLGAALLLAVVGHELALAAGELPAGETGLRAAEHGVVWGVAVLMVAGAALTAGGLAVWRLLALRLRLRMTPTLRPPDGVALLRSWATVTLLAIASFLAQENLEHVTQHGHVPLLDPLFSGQYVAVPPVFAGLGLLLAAACLAVGTAISQFEQTAPPSNEVRRAPPRRVGSWRTLLHDRRPRTRMLTAFSPRRGPPRPACF